MTPTLTNELDTAERSLRKMFPTATRIDIDFTSLSRPDAPREMGWSILVHFHIWSKRPPLGAEAPTLVQAMVSVMAQDIKRTKRMNVAAANN